MGLPLFYKCNMTFRRTTVITVGLVAFLGGLGLSRSNWLISHELVISCVLLFVVSITRLRWLALIATVLLGLSLGWLRGQEYMGTLSSLLELNGIKTTAIVKAESDSYYNQRGQLTFDASHLRLADSSGALPGKLRISGFGEPAVFRGDTVRIQGRFYKTLGSRQLGMSYADLEVLSSGGNSVDNIRRNFSAGLASAVPEPQASFGLGLLIGQRTTLPKDVADQLSAIGLTHIIAVSGYNLTIIVRGVRRLLGKRSKYQVTVISFALIGTFLLMTGMSASIVRAAIVSSLSIIAAYYGRSFKPLLLISLAAAITAGFNPSYIWSDIGWYLSFLAFFGVMILSPLIIKRIYSDRRPSMLTMLVSESACAMLMTMPLIMFVFKQVSIVALPANVLLVPLVPLAMLVALIAGLAGMFVPLIAGLFAWPAMMLLTAMLDAVMLISKIPGALLQQALSLTGLLTIYSLVCISAVIMWRKTIENAKVTDVKTES